MQLCLNFRQVTALVASWLCALLLCVTKCHGQNYNAILNSRVADCEQCLQPEFHGACRSLTKTCIEWLTCPQDDESNGIARRAKSQFTDINCNNRIKYGLRDDPYCKSFWQQMFFDAADDSDRGKFCNIALGSPLNITLNGYESAILEMLRKKLRDQRITCVRTLIEYKGDDKSVIEDYFGVRQAGLPSEALHQSKDGLNVGPERVYIESTQRKGTYPYKKWMVFSPVNRKKVNKQSLIRKAVDEALRKYDKWRVVQNGIGVKPHKNGLMITIMIKCRTPPYC